MWTRGWTRWWQERQWEEPMKPAAGLDVRCDRPDKDDGNVSGLSTKGWGCCLLRGGGSGRNCGCPTHLLCPQRPLSTPTIICLCVLWLPGLLWLKERQGGSCGDDSSGAAFKQWLMRTRGKEPASPLLPARPACDTDSQSPPLGLGSSCPHGWLLPWPPYRPPVSYLYSLTGASQNHPSALKTTCT